MVNNKNMKITPLFLGIHKVKKTDKQTSLPEHTSSVTLIQTEGKNILVDVGARGTIEKVKSRLKEEGLSLNEIDLVLLTHFHLDHAYNLAYFENSRVIGWMHEWKSGETLRIPEIDEYEVCKGIKLLKAEGHAEEHLAVEVKEDDGKITIISGDAISKEYIEHKKVARFFYDKDLYIKSAEKILSRADRIIPGHGEIIEL